MSGGRATSAGTGTSEQRSCPQCGSEFVEVLAEAPAAPPQSVPDPQPFMPHPPNSLFRVLGQESHTYFFADVPGQTFMGQLQGPGAISFTLGSGPERLMETLVPDVQEERPTEQGFLDKLPRLLVKLPGKESTNEGQPYTEAPQEFAEGTDASAGQGISQHAVVGEPCSICHDAYEYGHEVVELPCNHCFHEDCIMTWLTSHHTCPVCRQELPAGPLRRVPAQGVGQQHDGQGPISNLAGQQGEGVAQLGPGQQQNPFTGLAGLANQIVQSLPQQLAAAFGVIHSDFGFGSFPEAANFAGYEATMSYPEGGNMVDSDHTDEDGGGFPSDLESIPSLADAEGDHEEHVSLWRDSPLRLSIGDNDPNHAMNRYMEERDVEGISSSEDDSIQLSLHVSSPGGDRDPFTGPWRGSGLETETWTNESAVDLPQNYGDSSTSSFSYSGRELSNLDPQRFAQERPSQLRSTFVPRTWEALAVSSDSGTSSPPSLRSASPNSERRSTGMPSLRSVLSDDYGSNGPPSLRTVLLSDSGSNRPPTVCSDLSSASGSDAPPSLCSVTSASDELMPSCHRSPIVKHKDCSQSCPPSPQSVSSGGDSVLAFAPIRPENPCPSSGQAGTTNSVSSTLSSVFAEHEGRTFSRVDNGFAELGPSLKTQTPRVVEGLSQAGVGDGLVPCGGQSQLAGSPGHATDLHVDPLQGTSNDNHRSSMNSAEEDNHVGGLAAGRVACVVGGLVMSAAAFAGIFSLFRAR